MHRVQHEARYTYIHHATTTFSAPQIQASWSPTHLHDRQRAGLSICTPGACMVSRSRSGVSLFLSCGVCLCVVGVFLSPLLCVLCCCDVGFADP